MRKVLFILGELADSDLDWMIHNGAKQACGAGTVLIREGTPIDMIYVVLDGRFEVTLSSLGDRPVAVLQSGEILGELSYLDSRPPSATVTALEDSSVLAIPRERLTENLDQDARFAARFYRALGIFLASRLRRSQQQLGYEDRDRVLSDDVVHEDELDPDLLDGLALAGARFDWMLKRLRQAPAGGTVSGEGGSGGVRRP